MTRDKRRDRQLNIDLWLIFKVQNRHFVFLVLVCLIFAPREIRKYAQKECIYKAKTAPCFFYIKKPAVYRPTINFYLGIDCYFFFHAFFLFLSDRSWLLQVDSTMAIPLFHLSHTWGIHIAELSWYKHILEMHPIFLEFLPCPSADCFRRILLLHARQNILKNNFEYWYTRNIRQVL